TVAVIGASADIAKTAGRPVAYLLKHGFSGVVYPVNPKATEICGLPCYPDIASLPTVPDVGIVLLGAERAHQAVKELAQIGCAAAIVLASGYTEVGEEGAKRQAELIAAAGSMRILGPNTIGLVNITDQIVLSASGALEMDHFPSGSISLVSQSGGILGSLLARASARGIGLAKMISTSNEVDLELADFIDWLVDDEATKVIALYVETVRNTKKFRAAALRARQAGKPIVAFKIGRSEAGAKAAISHTGALAGSDKMYDALFKQAGILRAQRFDELLDMPAALATGRSLRGNRVAILTSTGGAGTLVSDALGVTGFETPPPDAETAAKLRALQQGDHAALDRNPIDVTLAGLQPELLKGAISAVLSSPTYDALVVIVGASALAMPELMSNAIKSCMSLSDKPILAYISPHAPNIGSLLTQGGVPAFSAPESCSAALVAMLHARQPMTSEPVKAIETAAQRSTINALPSGSLDEEQAKRLFSSFGIAAVRETIVTTPEQAQTALSALGKSAVLKILSSEILHKSEIGGVAVNVSIENISNRLLQMTQDVTDKAGITPQRFLVQEMVSSGIEIILGMHRDVLGVAILLGMGGVTAELLQDTTLRLLPSEGGLSAETAREMALSLKTWPLLDGYRGRPKADVEALVKAIVDFSTMVATLGDRLLEAEINPLFVLEHGQGVKAADGIVVLSNA
ncbi:MAG: acetate--CoA ligase family protein, partial [Zwartia sp.]